MATEIRPITTDEELIRANFVLGVSFMGDRTPEGRMRHVEKLGESFGLYDSGQMVACLRVFPLRMYIHGEAIPLGGVSGVACLPEARRKGYVGRLLRHALVVMRDAGQPISALYTPHPSLYRRYGWMFAASDVLYTFNPKHVALADHPSPDGRAYRVSEEDWPLLSGMYDRFAAPRNGYLVRDEFWWKEAVFRPIYDDKRKPRDAIVWENDRGEATGYVLYHTTRQTYPDRPGEAKTLVEDFVALDGDAFAGIMRHLLSHDLSDELSIWGPPDDPLMLAIDEPWETKRHPYFGFMLRIVDIEKAFAARPAARDAPEGSFTAQLSDAAALWNQGVWRIECSGGTMSATKVDGPAQLSTDAAAFAAMYNGYLRPSEAVRVGLAQTESAEAVAMADRILAVDYPPFPSESF